MWMRPYLRVSDAKKGRSESTSQQLGELGRDADEQGWQLGDPYEDEGISASEYATKPRPDFARLLADLRQGTFGAHVLGAWEASRLSRQTEEWLELLRLAKAAGVRIWIHTDETLYNPANAKHRQRLLRDAVDSEFESAQTRQRVVRDTDAAAVDGRPAGQAPFGYRRTYDPHTKALVAQEIVPDEAEVIRTIYRRLDKGHTLRKITMDLNAEGVRSRAGRVLSEQVVRGWATKPAYAAFRKRDGKLYPGDPDKWPPIIDPLLWHDVQRRLSDPRRRVNRDGQGRHLLSMIAACDLCDAPMTSSQRKGEPWHLRCHGNCGIQVNEALLDQIAEERIWAALDELESQPRAATEETPELAQVRTDLAAARREHTELGASLSDRRISVELAAMAEPAMLATIARLEKRETELATPPVLSRLVAPAKIGADRWEVAWRATPMSARREVARILLRPGVLGQLRVGRVTTNRWCDECRTQTCVHRVAARLVWRQE